MTRIGLLCAILLVAQFTSSQDTRTMTPEDVARIKSVASAILSTDGEHIAYTLRVQADPKVENRPASTHLYIYDLQSDMSRAFVTRSSVRSVSFRPESNSVTFLGNMGGSGGTSLYEIPMSGGEATELLSHETSISSYDWSPDGAQIAFVAREKADKPKSDLPYQPEIYEGNLDFNRAWISALEGSTGKLNIDGHITGLKWSPDGKSIMLSVAETPLVDDFYMKRRFVIYSIDQGEVVATIDHKGKQGQFCWSPDAKQVAFIAGADIHDPVAGRLFVAGVEGGKPRQINADWEGAYEALEWIDQERIHYLGSKGAASVYGTVRVSDGEMSEILTNAMAVGAFDANSDGEICMVASTPQNPSELYYSAGDDTERLTDSNPWLNEIAMGEQEVVRYPASDGLEIEGILVHPVDYNAAEQYPLLVVVHGGPEAHIDNGWVTAYSRPGQVAAGKGYAVFYPNYRGSTGRGVEFTMTSQSDAAGKEFDDIVDGVDYLIEMGLADADKVGVTGGSYGGYATAWLSTRYTEKFAAGVMFVGISNKVSKWGTTDIPNEEYLVHAREWVYDKYDFYLERSPIYHAGQCETPLLIMHGKEDPRVHPSQSMEMYRHVKSRTDTPVELIFYPGEGHGNRNSTARYDYNLRMLDWFDKYVMNAERS